MKTKWVNFFILWAMLVMVQVSTILIVDFTSNIAMLITTSIGTALTLYLGLKVERKRVTREVHRVEADRKSDQIRELRDAVISEKIVQFRDSPIVVDEVGIVLPKYEPFFMPNDPRIRPNLVTDGTRIYELEDRHAVRTWEAIKAEEKETLEADPDICKHCYRQIKGAVHVEGMAKGKMRCDPEDTLSGYGFNAEPSDAECGPTCIGHP